ncbi:MAG: hypothetical protein GTO12_13960, partial [Proteobacteria bacterium]|nr:hypothetical protein [Pseudomonadota bacterium]
MADRPRLIDEIGKIFARETTEKILARIKAVGLVVGPARALKEVGQDPMVQERLVRASDPKTNVEVVLGSTPVETTFLKSSRYRLSFPPRLGEHNR